eukprot:TRINITY_DN11937_c0_g1_i1.p1 TRINITY_DN11937_c0_g1~~TRINITY_DN11937_c0_g1_i1.p1  ORF type:complete len:71 (-),score=5.84 TRINITY_DN11937_c0_g1_i1:291-503(-)
MGILMLAVLPYHGKGLEVDCVRVWQRLDHIKEQKTMIVKSVEVLRSLSFEVNILCLGCRFFCILFLGLCH